ncbi:hypothetical protein PHYSODRAFT_494550 [Phytophthora sojae]|uniref:Uncharacterized protein n=1 Tax=Phytophthora sojae (strain P6497) TaxID=1094619 RepID=G4Z1X0_PHYSP|nr:hypothetical protein PHYSODRAFT_494550 [Phytophthora sojae]EGZ19968.1 hypothetical protein PHYSODRAFT_494550 [Phytophthora sojae]|eukprot:XP_009522685.1 hypothetical protein PHYSODRAFT_494550 [Phytophthora sojae]
MNDSSTPEQRHRTDSGGHRPVLHPSGGYVSVPVDFVATPLSSPQDDLLCKYTGSRCANPRSLKKNGERHNLYEFHRERANANQSRFDAKQRQQRQSSSSEAADLPEPIPVPVNSPDPPLNEWEADLLLETMQNS